MSTKNHLNRIVYTDGSNGIVRLEPRIWRAFYEAALYLDMDSVQQTFTMFIEFGGCFTKDMDFVAIVDLLQGEAPKMTENCHLTVYDGQCAEQTYDSQEVASKRRSLRHWLTNYDNTYMQLDSVSAAATEFSLDRIKELSNWLWDYDIRMAEIPF